MIRCRKVTMTFLFSQSQPGSRERIEHYRRRATDGKPLFDAGDDMQNKWILAIDTETNDMPKGEGREPDDVDCWPRMVQLGMVLASPEGKPALRAEMLIRPSDWLITDGCYKVHGIKQTDCEQMGVPLFSALWILRWAMCRADTVVAHNMAFDWPVLLCESKRMQVKLPDIEGQRHCTMLAGVDLCKLPGKDEGYKRPRLSELYECLFDEKFKGAHSALADAEACLRCFQMMQTL